MTKCLATDYLKRKVLFPLTVQGPQSIAARMSQHQECEAADPVAFIVREPRVMNPALSLLSPFYKVWDPQPVGMVQPTFRVGLATSFNPV